MNRLILLSVLFLTAMAAHQARAAAAVIFYPPALSGATSFADSIEALAPAEAGWLGQVVKVPLVPLDPGDSLARLRELKPRLVFTYGAFATRSARSVLPKAWLIYAGVPFPENEGFIEDDCMVGVAAWGSPQGLFQLLNSVRPVRKLAVLYSDMHDASVRPLLARLKEAGFDPSSIELNEAPVIEDVVRSIMNGGYGALLILPSPPMSNPDRLRYVITQCVRGSILPVAGDPALVQEGALCAVTPGSRATAATALAAGRKLLSTGSRGQALYWPSTFLRIVNQSVEAAFRLDRPLPADRSIE